MKLIGENEQIKRLARDFSQFKKILDENERAKVYASEYQKLYDENEQNKKLVQELQDLKKEIEMVKQFSNVQLILD